MCVFVCRWTIATNYSEKKKIQPLWHLTENCENMHSNLLLLTWLIPVPFSVKRSFLCCCAQKSEQYTNENIHFWENKVHTIGLMYMEILYACAKT